MINKTNNERQFEILYATSIPSGYGHRKITVEIAFNGRRNAFTATTDNMPAYDAATDLEGEEKEQALFKIVKRQLNDKIEQWMYEVEEMQA